LFLSIDGLSAGYGGTRVLEEVSFSLERGEIVSLIGPSGSGKSTVLRCLVGLVAPSAGQVSLDGAPVDYGSRAAVRGVRDRLAIVFQQYNLFQNMTALDNVAIAPMKVKGWPKTEVMEDARKLLAIARALALKPDVLLLDEVTSALDPELVTEVLDTIRGLAANGMTMLVVSHEMAFVREVSSRVLFMDRGRVIETGPPAELFDAPKTERARDFVTKILRH
jgi:polar amino acid transport system ATP-binding protein